jgi:hypothetical protein
MKLKLSEAIRLGAMLKPKGYGNGAMAHGAAATCALGAAAEAAGLKLKDSDYKAVIARWPLLRQQVVMPGERSRRIDFCAAICDLNDHYGWTREQIGDWVETIENQQDEKTAIEVTYDPVHGDDDLTPLAA